jgi:chemotaxis protein methyltransferase CheR
MATSIPEVQRFRDLIAANLGLQFEDAKMSFLADVLHRRLAASQRGAAHYLAELADAPRRELDALAHELTVPETYFFRHLDQLLAFADVAVPARVAARGAQRTLRVLSAGCASGEEPYTLAIMLRGLMTDPGWRVDIRAVDINRNALDRAQSARFTSWSLRETPTQMRGRWFRAVGRELLLDDSIRAQVHFEQRNLTEDDRELWPTGVYDAVFCRNVLMYLTPPAAAALVERIARALVPGGYLFLGHAETLRGMTDGFHLCHSHNAFYYQVRGPNEPSRAPRGTPTSDLTTVPRPPDTTETEDSWFETISRAADRIRLLVEERAASAPRSGAPVPPVPAPATAGRAADLIAPIELLRQERFGEALALVRALPSEAAGDPDVRMLEAVLLAHSGRLGEAEEACLDLLRSDQRNAGAHYVLALCCAGSGDGRRAVGHAETAARIDPGFAMPRLQLGLLARRAGEQIQARRELSHALILLQREAPSRLLFFGGGFNRDALVSLCRAELVAAGGRP